MKKYKYPTGLGIGLRVIENLEPDDRVVLGKDTVRKLRVDEQSSPAVWAGYSYKAGDTMSVFCIETGAPTYRSDWEMPES